MFKHHLSPIQRRLFALACALPTALSACSSQPLALQENAANDDEGAALVEAASGASYYVDAKGGNDQNGGRGSNPLDRSADKRPWKTLAKVNSMVRSGDTVYLARSSAWEETLEVKAGVNYLDYRPTFLDTSKPLIRGSKSLQNVSWSRYRDNVFVADLKGLDITRIGGLALANGTRLGRARHPNVGSGDFGAGSRYLRHQSAAYVQDGISTLTTAANALPAGADLTSACGSSTTQRADCKPTAFVRGNEYALVTFSVEGSEPASQTLRLAQTSPGFGEMKPGFGYWLENKLWMLDAPSEWYFDPAAQRLYVWMPDGRSPANQDLWGSVRANGIRAVGADGSSVSNIEVRDTLEDGVLYSNSAGINISGVEVVRPGARGIALEGCSNGKVDHVRVADSTKEAVWMAEPGVPSTRSKDIDLTNSRVERTALGGWVRGAVLPGQGGRVAGNVIDGASFVGIRAWKETTIEKNVVLNTCQSFNDCSAIYTISRGERSRVTGQELEVGYPLNLTIADNIVRNAPGSGDGRSPGATGTSTTAGIYLDDYAHSVTVTNNFVSGTGDAISLHFAQDVTLDGNTTFGNRAAELRISEKPVRPGIPLVANKIIHNVFVSTSESGYVTARSNDGSRFVSSFEGNLYGWLGNPMIDRFDAEPASSVPSYQRSYDSFREVTDEARTIPLFYGTVGGVLAVPGASELVPNGTLETSAFGTDKDTLGSVLQAGCVTGRCVSLVSRITPAGSVALLKFYPSPTTPFSVRAGGLYAVSLDTRSAEANAGYVDIVVRDTAPNASGLRWTEATSPTKLRALSTEFKRSTHLLAGLTNTGASGRLDLEFFSRAKVDIDNVHMVEVTKQAGQDNAFALYNEGTTWTLQKCPLADTSSPQCREYIELKTGQPVVFPFWQASGAATVVAWKNSPWQDDDRDGVPNKLDVCPSTLAAAGSDERGCGPGQ